jgi:hypothetical protein
MAVFIKARRLWGKTPLTLQWVLAFSALLLVFSLTQYILYGTSNERIAGNYNRRKGPARVPKQARIPQTDQPPENRLAYLDAQNEGRQIGDDHPTVDRIKELLEIISEQTGEDYQEIAEQTIACTELAREKHGKIITNLRLLEEASTLLEASPGTSYRDAAELVMKLMVQ